MIFRWIIFLLFIFCLNIYSSQAIKTLTKSSWIQYIFITFNIIVLANFIIQTYFLDRSELTSPYFSYSLGIFLTTAIFQLLVIIFILFEDLFRIPQWIYHILSKGLGNSFNFMPERRHFISQLAVLLASIPASALFIGMLRGKYSYRVINHLLSFENFQYLLKFLHFQSPLSQNLRLF